MKSDNLEALVTRIATIETNIEAIMTAMGLTPACPPAATAAASTPAAPSHAVPTPAPAAATPTPTAPTPATPTPAPAAPAAPAVPAAPPAPPAPTNAVPAPATPAPAAPAPVASAFDALSDPAPFVIPALKTYRTIHAFLVDWFIGTRDANGAVATPPLCRRLKNTAWKQKCARDCPATTFKALSTALNRRAVIARGVAPCSCATHPCSQHPAGILDDSNSNSRLTFEARFASKSDPIFNSLFKLYEEFSKKS